MKKLLFIYPPSTPVLREDRCPVPGRNVVMSPPLPPTDLMYMAAIGEEAGCTCRIADYPAEKRGMNDFIDDLNLFQPELLVVHTTTPTMGEDLKACRVARRSRPDLVIAAKGSHFLRFDREVLESAPALDMVIRGEPEITLKEILAGTRLEEVAGITWRRGGRTVRNPDRPFHETLDDFPFPARHLVDHRRYRRPDTGRPLAVVKVSRGCPYYCFFCLATPVSGRTVRLRQPERIVEELSACVREFGFRDFILWSDVFNFSKPWVLELCNAISSSGLDVRWSASIRADLMDLETGKAMRSAGCELVSIGIETGSQEMLDQMDKKTTLDALRRGVAASQQAGLKTLGYFMFGLPWETEESLSETLRFALELNTDYASFFVAAPLPGTKFFDYALEEGLMQTRGLHANGLFGNAYYQAMLDSAGLGAGVITEFRNKAVRAYFFRPRYLARRLAGIGSWQELVSHVRAGLSLLRR